MTGQPGLFMKIVARRRKWFRGKEGEPDVRRRIDQYVEDGWRSLTLLTKPLVASQQIAHE